MRRTINFEKEGRVLYEAIERQIPLTYDEVELIKTAVEEYPAVSLAEELTVKSILEKLEG